ncbi:unnamed protein product [Cyprideis torosa]|uniref:Uncharacterized protein n=1 Tax=Cyprideis torosa TaxID=163714 RepID=A0A7R8W9N7_9CRUS|nr:unnamed protein product [Cyprideis torosa]CAG0890013.1 unnamed protein product [Cyprideis torosa]
MMSEKDLLSEALKAKETNASIFSPEGIAKRDWFLFVIPTGKGYAGGVAQSSLALWWLVNNLLVYNLLRRRGLAHEFRSQIAFARVPYLKTPQWMHLDGFIYIIGATVFFANLTQKFNLLEAMKRTSSGKFMNAFSFEELGKIKGYNEHKIRLKQGYVPVKQKQRPILYVLRDKVAVEIQRLGGDRSLLESEPQDVDGDEVAPLRPN